MQTKKKWMLSISALTANPPTADEVQPSVKKGLMTPNNEQTISVKDTEKVFGWVGRNEPSKEQLEALMLQNKAIEKGITGVELRQLLAQAAEVKLNGIQKL